MKVVLDTNLIVSGIGWGGTPGRVWDALRAGQHQIVTSLALLEELERVLAYPRLSSLTKDPIFPEVWEWLHQPEHLVYPTETLLVIVEDPPDNRLLEAAVAGKADVIVSGDHHLLALGTFREIPIISAAEFAARHLPPPGRPPAE